MSKSTSGSNRIPLIDLDRIYQRKIKGTYQRLRRYGSWGLLCLYFLTPWFMWGERQLVLFDLPQRQFHVFHMTFWPQDFFLLALLLIISAFGLFMVTVYAGRIWCGYTCPQTVWTQLFVWLEMKIEGSRNQRIKLDAAPWGFQKLLRKSSKHLSWGAIALATGITFIGYFTPIRALVPDFFTLDANFQAALWIMIFGVLTYLNAGWMREKVCIYMCPYARFQSVMFDEDTKVVSYDVGRGEPRGKKTPTSGAGDCVDCGVCVQVCPTGIDIRDGLQYECIGCALCIDACDSVMQKLERPKGLIRYSTENELAGKITHFLRPRLIGYAIAMTVMVVSLTVFLALRSPLELSIERGRGQLFTEALNGDIVNSMQVSILNKSENTQTFEFFLEGRPGAQLSAPEQVIIAPGERVTKPVQVSLEPQKVVQARLPFTLRIEAVGGNRATSTIDSTFIGPERW
ncbi:cytochrome c oxidase accessory protein CcoG [Litorivicinus lipolyticus]|uniref:Cytochrome c oxidase accessory protein CcoG n=1 Tax=Litorivicinus lipolyticus TaxID=418701 RepID=A0A5Q2QEE5_9GAMM|nr:cytochrome c oxidase accessory protein CcoG [Litorivicinus lipolyticus]